MNQFIVFTIASSLILIAILYGLFLIKIKFKKSTGNEKMNEIAKAIQQGAKAYLNRQYKTISIIAIVLFLILYIISFLIIVKIRSI